jgi:raffinose/stachyose/melibiose transport system substrate-binding protein
MDMNKKTMRSIKSVTLISTVALLTLSACSSSQPGSTPAAGGSKEASAPVTITWGLHKPKQEAEEKVYNKIITEYNKVNPKVQVKLAFTEYTDAAQWNTWLNAQLIGGAAPDLVSMLYVPAMENFRKGLVVDLKPYLDKPNPFDSKPRSWWDSFSSGLINQNMDNTNRAVPSVPLATVAVKVFYNKELFDKAGIKSTPKTYSELIEISEKLKTAGTAPFIAPNKSPADNVMNWLHRMFMDQMIEPLIPQLDKDKNGLVELNEIVAGTKAGIIDLDKSPWSDSVNIIKGFSKYWYPGYNGIDNMTALDLFIKQQGAMIMQTGDNLRKIIDNPDRKFEVAFFPFPNLTKKDSPHAVEKLYEMGGAPQQTFAIPNSVKGEKLDAAVNFLQYLSSEKGAALFAEGFWWSSPIKDAVLPDKLKGMFIEGNTSSLRLLAPTNSQKLFQNDTMIGQLFLEGKVTDKEFNAQLNKDLKEAVDQISKQNNWNEANGWGTKK